MRLLFSLAVLLILACLVLEISGAKSKRDTAAEATKGNHKSGNSKEVRYSNSKNRGNGKKEEVSKGKKQRRNVEGNENIESNGVSGNEEQKRQKFNKEKEFDKSGENFRNNKNAKVTKDAAKRYKRFTESEDPEKNFPNVATDSSAQNEESQLNLASKKEAKKKFEKKSGNGIGKNFDGVSESEAIVNMEGTSDDQQSKETASSLNNNVKSSRKDKNTEEQHGKLKKMKQQKQNQKSEKSRKESVDLKKSESAKEKIRTSEEAADLDTTSESLNNLPEEKTRSANMKKQKSSKKAECEYQVNDCKLSIPNTQKSVTEKSKKYKSVNCRPEAKFSTDKNRTHTEKSKYIADTRSSDADIEQDEDSENFDLKLTDEIEEPDHIIETENCMLADSVQENVMQESQSPE